MMAATPGKMGFLSVAVQYYADSKLVCTVPPRAFRPPPKVTSAVVRLDIRPVPAVKVTDEEAFFALGSGRVRLTKEATEELLGSRAQVAHNSRQSTFWTAWIWTEAEGQQPCLLEEWASIYGAWERQDKVGNPGLC